MRHVPKRPVPAKERQMYESWNHTTQPPSAPKSPSDDKNLPEIQFLLQSTGPRWPLQRAGQDSGLLPKLMMWGPACPSSFPLPSETRMDSLFYHHSGHRRRGPDSPRCSA